MAVCVYDRTLTLYARRPLPQAVMAPGERIKCILQVQGEAVRGACAPDSVTMHVLCV